MEIVHATIETQGAYLHEAVFDSECSPVLYVHSLFFRKNEHSLVFALFYTDISSYAKTYFVVESHGRTYYPLIQLIEARVFCKMVYKTI